MMAPSAQQQAHPFHHYNTHSYAYDQHLNAAIPASPSSEESVGQRRVLNLPHTTQHMLSAAVSQSDRTSVQIVRYLQQTRHILREMELLCGQICAMSITRDDAWDSLELFKALFVKFLRVSNMLLTILSQMETSPIIRPERINSFRADVWEDCRSAADLRSRVLQCLGQHDPSFSPPSPSPLQDQHRQQSLPGQPQS